MTTPTSPSALPTAPAQANGQPFAPAWIESVADTSSRMAPYQLIADQLRREIAAGSFAPGSRLPSGRELQQRLGVSSGTVRSAVRLLKHEGLVYSVQGRGNYVRRDQASAPRTATMPSDPIGSFSPSQQIASELRQQITTGRLAQGSKLPSYRELEQRYAVASMTARSALRVLRAEGLVHTVCGRGTYVTRNTPLSPAPVGEETTGGGARHTASTITDAALDELYDQLADLQRRVAAYERGMEATA
ncbi:GntR family transcriptional regulator [Streptomyces sp. NPDC001407]|uniref:GntR family transcriptional regulator n=1 Tax=Streptomyces sp. NPDC001407 TaxID=3364573 RepID=UPI0036922B54